MFRFLQAVILLTALRGGKAYATIPPTEIPDTYLPTMGPPTGMPYTDEPTFVSFTSMPSMGPPTGMPTFTSFTAVPTYNDRDTSNPTYYDTSAPTFTSFTTYPTHSGHTSNPTFVSTDDPYYKIYSTICRDGHGEAIVLDSHNNPVVKESVGFLLVPDGSENSYEASGMTNEEGVVEVHFKFHEEDKDDSFSYCSISVNNPGLPSSQQGSCKVIECSGSTECPSAEPDWYAACSFDVPDGCSYGEETCCGKTYPSVKKFCMDGEIHGYYTDACLHPHCDASSYGDPHFKTWSGDQFDFHGKCDLVLYQKTDFAHGLGLDVHIRTEIETWWSYIERAAIRLGEHTLEVMGGKDTFQYWINEESNTMMDGEEIAFGDFVLKYKVVNEHVHRFRLDLGDGDAISIETYKKFVRVNFKPKTEQKFAGGLGMLGSQPDGRKLARDGTTVIEDPLEFGQEWQVLATEAKLFHGEGVETPLKCVMPSDTEKSQSRRLGQSMITHEDAEVACAHAWEGDRDACIFDVLASNDLDSAGSYDTDAGSY